MKNLIFAVVFLAFLCNVSYAQEHYYWSPTNTYLGANEVRDYTQKTYYCIDGSIKKIYPKDSLENMQKQREEMGFEGQIPGVLEMNTMYENGKCKLITGHKTLYKPSYYCTGYYSNTEFIDIASCNMPDENFKKVTASGKTRKQIDKVFENSQEKIRQEFISGKAK